MLRSISGESSFGKYDFMYLRIDSSNKDRQLADTCLEVMRPLVPADAIPRTILIAKVVQCSMRL
jgi:hypothetical protein